MSSFHLWFKWLHHRTLLTPHVSPCFTVKLANPSKTSATFLQILLPLTSVFFRDDQETNKTLGELKQRGGRTLRAVIPEKAHTHTHAHHQSAHTLSTAGLQTRSALHCTAWKPALLLHFNYTTLSSRQLCRKHAQLK